MYLLLYARTVKYHMFDLKAECYHVLVAEFIHTIPVFADKGGNREANCG